MSDKVVFDFELNTGGSQRSIKEINDRIKQLTTELKKADIGSKTFNDLNRELAATRVQAKNLNQEFKNLQLEVQIDTLPSENSILGLQNTLKLLKDEIKGVDFGTEEYKRLETEIANINIEMKGVKEGLRGLDFGAVLGEAGAVLSGVAGAAGMLNDVLMDGNEESAKYIENATRTIMVMQGVQGVMAGVDSATKLLNITMEKNPIMIWVAAAAALVGGLIALVKWIRTTNDETDTFNKLSKEQQSLVRKTTTEYTRYRLELAQTNGNIKEQISLQEQLRLEEFREKIRETADAFGLEASAVENATSTYTDYQNNLEKIKQLNADIKNNKNEYITATIEEKNELLKSRRVMESSVTTLIKQNYEYTKLYGGVAKFKELNKNMAKEEAIYNANRQKDYEQTFKTILADGRTAYEGLRSAYQSMVESLRGYQEDIAQSIADVNMRRIEQEIEDAKRLGDVQQVVAKEKLKLELEIADKIKERKKNEEEIIKTEIEGRLAIREALQKTKIADQQLIGLRKQQDDINKNIITNNKEMIRLNNLAIEAYEKGDASRADALQTAISAIKLQNQEYEKQVKVLVSDSDVQREIINYNKEQVKLYEDQAKQLKTNSLISDNIKALTKEIGELQAKQNRAQKEFIDEALRSIKEYTRTIQDEINNIQLANYEKFLNDSKELLTLSEQEKADKVLEITGIRLGLERRQLEQSLKENLSQYELYLRTIDDKYTKNFDGMLDILSKDPEAIGEITSKVTAEINKQREQILQNLANNIGDKDVQIAKLEILQNQQSALAGITLKSDELKKISDNELLNLQRKNENLKIYQDELKRLNEAQRAANEKEIEDTLRIVSLGKEKMNALMTIEQMKAELYEGTLKKETEAVKKQLLIRKDLEESAALELYEKKIITHEQYLEEIGLIEDLYRKRSEQAERDSLNKKLEIAQVLYEGFFTTLSNSQNDILNERLANIDTETTKAISAQKEQADNNLITQQQYERNVAEIENEANEKKRKLQREQAQKDRQYAVYQAILNTLVAITKALPNPVAVALAGATGAAQVAAASSTPIPQFEYGGVIGGKRHSQGGTVIEAEQDEIILKRGVRSNPVLNNMASMINEAVGGNSFRLPMSSSVSGMSDKKMIQDIVTATVSGVKSIPVINVATDTQKVNNKVTRLQNKAKL